MAKPWKWGSSKRETIYDVCSADLRKRQIEEYRCAARKSELVYPLGARLPRPSSVAAAAVKVAATSRMVGKKRQR